MNNAKLKLNLKTLQNRAPNTPFLTSFTFYPNDVHSNPVIKTGDWDLDGNRINILIDNELELGEINIPVKFIESIKFYTL